MKRLFVEGAYYAAEEEDSLLNSEHGYMTADDVGSIVQFFFSFPISELENTFEIYCAQFINLFARDRAVESLRSNTCAQKCGQPS